MFASEMTDLIDTEVAQVQHEQYAQASAAVGSQVGGRRPMSSAQAYQEAVKQAWARALVHVEPSIQLQRDLCQPEFGKEASHPPSSVARQAEAIASQGVSKRVEKRRSAGLDSIGASSVLSSGSSYSCSSASSSSTQSSTLSLSAKADMGIMQTQRSNRLGHKLYHRPRGAACHHAYRDGRFYISGEID